MVSYVRAGSYVLQRFNKNFHASATYISFPNSDIVRAIYFQELRFFGSKNTTEGSTFNLILSTTPRLFLPPQGP